MGNLPTEGKIGCFNVFFEKWRFLNCGDIMGSGGIVFMKKIFAVFLSLFMLIVCMSAKEYHTSVTVDGEDIDDLVFINNTDGNVTIRYEGINKSGVFDLAKGATKEIDANCQVSGTYQVRFEVKDSNGNLKDVTWTMEYKKKDINITLTEDSGWSF